MEFIPGDDLCLASQSGSGRLGLQLGLDSRATNNGEGEEQVQATKPRTHKGLRTYVKKNRQPQAFWLTIVDSMCGAFLRKEV
jgi:thiamine monophosphate kinase